MLLIWRCPPPLSAGRIRRPAPRTETPPPAPAQPAPAPQAAPSPNRTPPPVPWRRGLRSSIWTGAAGGHDPDRHTPAQRLRRARCGNNPTGAAARDSAVSVNRVAISPRLGSALSTSRTISTRCFGGGAIEEVLTVQMVPAAALEAQFQTADGALANEEVRLMLVHSTRALVAARRTNALGQAIFPSIPRANFCFTSRRDPARGSNAA